MNKIGSGPRNDALPAPGLFSHLSAPKPINGAKNVDTEPARGARFHPAQRVGAARRGLGRCCLPHCRSLDRALTPAPRAARDRREQRFSPSEGHRRLAGRGVARGGKTVLAALIPGLRARKGSAVFALIHRASPRINRNGQKPMTDITIFGFPASSFVHIVRLVLTHKEVPYTFHDLEPDMGSPKHLALHPFDRVPIL